MKSLLSFVIAIFFRNGVETGNEKLDMNCVFAKGKYFTFTGREYSAPLSGTRIKERLLIAGNK